MIKFNPENKNILTYGEALSPIVEIKTEEEARQYLHDYAVFIQKYLDKKPDPKGRTAIQIAKINIGYFSGYYDSETNKRVQELFNTAHPIFGRTEPTPEKALVAGKRFAEGKTKERELFEKNNGYRRYQPVPRKDCLSCGTSTSEPGEPYDRLHCSRMPPNDDVVDEDNICELWNGGSQ